MKPEHDIAPVTLADLRAQGIYFVRTPDGGIGFAPLPGHTFGEELIARIAASWSTLQPSLLAELEAEANLLKE